MSQSSVIAKLVKKFKPEFLGLKDIDDMQKRLLEYGAEKNTIIAGLLEAFRDAAFEAWVKYRAYDDAYDYWLVAPQTGSVDGEGSATFADRRTVLANLAKARDGALEEWTAIVNPVTATEPSSNQNPQTMSIPVEVVW
jgi:hypothetical protein